MKAIELYPILLLGILIFTGNAQAKEFVAICTTCTSVSQFEAAAKAEIGSWTGEHDVLAINPNTKSYYWFNIIHTNSSGGAGVPLASPLSVKAGKAISLDNTDKGITAAQANTATAATSATDSWTTSRSNLTAQESAEVGAIIDLTKTDSVIVLPDNGYFGSFPERNAEATSLQIYQSLTENNPAWAGRGLYAAFRQLVMNRIKSLFGKDPRVCAIFNNGDSACFEINFMAPSADKYIAGTARSISDQALPDSGFGGGSGEPMSVDYDPPNVGYGPRGATGSTGEVWLFCATQGGKVINCWIQRF